MDISIGVLSFEQMLSRYDIGSSRIRAHWLIKCWPDAELFRMGNYYSTIIFQKAYWLEYAMKYSGIKILDICDPDFLNWNSRCITMANHCDAVTTSTDALAQLISRYTSTPTICIPDRIDLEDFSRFRKDHRGNGPARTIAWFGYSTNYQAIDSAIPDMLRLGIRNLIVISDQLQQYKLPAVACSSISLSTHVWNYNYIHNQLLKADILINYQFDYGRWKYKSNNKSLFAWAIGIPVAHSSIELEAWMIEEARIIESKARLLEVYAEYDIKRSVEDYKALIISLGKRE